MISLTATEKRGYDSNTVVLKIPTRALERPDLLITDYRLNDAKTGLANGNGNGIPENSETVEIIPFVKNQGVGAAVQVELGITAIDDDIELNRPEVVIPVIQPGGIQKSRLAFTIPRTYTGTGAITLELRAADARGVSTAQKHLSLAGQSHRPALAYTHKIQDADGNGKLTSGEQAVLEIIPTNSGGLEARAVVIEVDAPVLGLAKRSLSVGNIAPRGKAGAQRFTFQVPRTLEQAGVEVQVTLSQQDFPAVRERIYLPIVLVRPEFGLSHQLLSPRGDSIAKQGERVELLVRVKNSGQLDARNVTLRLHTLENGDLRPGVKRHPGTPLQTVIGTLRAGHTSEPQRFILNIQRRAQTGELPVHFTVSQQDFHPQERQVTLKIVKDEPIMVETPSQEVLQRPAAGGNSAPLIVIAAPQNEQRTVDDTLRLEGAVGDDRGIASIGYELNGQIFTLADRDLSADSSTRQRFSVKIPLQMGKNILRVTALDIDNQRAGETLEIHREAGQGAIYGVVIGINRYQHVPSLDYARNDAQGFARYLRTHLGLDDARLWELYDEQATVTAIRSALGTKLKAAASQPEDTVFIFYAGHGAPEEDPHSADGDGVAKYILPHGADPQDLYSTAIPMDEIARLFRRLKAGRVIFISDSCFSGQSGGRTILAPASRRTLAENFMERLAQGKGRVILASSAANELSVESDTHQHGYFTYYLLQGLQGKADYNSGDGLIDINEISSYLNKTVPAATNGRQHPVRKGDTEGPVYIGKVLR